MLVYPCTLSLLSALIALATHCQNHFSCRRSIALASTAAMRKQSGTSLTPFGKVRTVITQSLCKQSHESGRGPFVWTFIIQITIASFGIFTASILLLSNAHLARVVYFLCWAAILQIELFFNTLRRRIAEDLRHKLSSVNSFSRVLPYLAVVCPVSFVILSAPIHLHEFVPYSRINIRTPFGSISVLSIIMSSYLCIHATWILYCSLNFLHHVTQSFTAVKLVDPRMFQKEMRPIRINTLLTVLSGFIWAPILGFLIVFLDDLNTQMGVLMIACWIHTTALFFCFDLNRQSFWHLVSWIACRNVKKETETEQPKNDSGNATRTFSQRMKENPPDIFHEHDDNTGYVSPTNMKPAEPVPSDSSNMKSDDDIEVIRRDEGSVGNEDPVMNEDPGETVVNAMMEGHSEQMTIRLGLQNLDVRRLFADLNATEVETPQIDIERALSIAQLASLDNAASVIEVYGTNGLGSSQHSESVQSLRVTVRAMTSRRDLMSHRRGALSL